MEFHILGTVLLYSRMTVENCHTGSDTLQISTTALHCQKQQSGENSLALFLKLYHNMTNRQTVYRLAHVW